MNGLNLGGQGPDTQHDDEPSTMPLVTAGGGGGDELPAAEAEALGLTGLETKSKLPQSTLLIVAIALIAAGALYLMRMSSGDATREAIASEVRAKIDQAVAKISNAGAMSETDPLRPDNIDELFRDTESVVAMFATDYTENQVPVEYVKKNPFVLERERETTANGTPVNDRRYEEWLASLKRDIAAFRLDAVVGGASPMAIIDGKPVGVGESLGRFTVDAVEGQTLRLRAVYEPTGKSVVVNLRMPG